MTTESGDGMARRRRQGGRGARRAAAVLACALLTTVTAGCDADVSVTDPSTSSRPSGGGGGTSRPAVAQARADLGELRVRSQGGGDGYSREEFGRSWKDTDRNGCDQRNDVLARDLEQVRKNDDCKVTSGRLHDPYSGKDITFTRSRPAEVQIDHIYPLALAWRMGADRWSEDRRERFANDPENLLAVWGVPNREKSDSGPAEWKPYEGFRCEYGIKYIAVARKYSLPVTSADRDALRGFLNSC